MRKFHDLNGDGRHSSDEPMLEGISFDIVETGTDGQQRRHNVTTDANGVIDMRFQGKTTVRIDELTRTTGMWAPPTILQNDVPLGCESVELWVPNAPVVPPKTGAGGREAPSRLDRWLGLWPEWVLRLLSEIRLDHPSAL